MTFKQFEQANTENDLPVIERVRHELKRRQLIVTSTEYLTPHMIRITVGGDDLEGFSSLSAGDHIKVFVPNGDGELTMRDYTPRRYDAQSGTLVLDFAVHQAGPATQWAIDARVGDTLQIGGPRGSQIITGPIRSWLLIGDETALPSIGRRIEEMAAGTPVTSLVSVPEPADCQSFETQAAHTAHWTYSSTGADIAAMIEQLNNIAIEPGTFVWLAAEASVARALRTYLIEERKHPLVWLRATGYWVKGKADSGEKFDD